MIGNEKNNNICNENQSRQVMSRPSLFETFKAVKVQVDYDCFVLTSKTGMQHIDSIYHEVCLIIAEVYIQSPDNLIKIHGEQMSAYLVQEVYRELRHEHIEFMLDNFKKQTGLIHNKMAYIRTVLYNSLFEYELHYTNLVNHDLHLNG